MKKNNYPLRIFLIFLLTLVLGVYTSQVTTFPHTSDFESGFGDWYNAPGDDFDWLITSGSGTPSSGTGPQTAPYGANGTNGYVYVESSSPNYPDKQGWLDINADFKLLTSPEMIINYHMYASNGSGYGPGILQLDIWDGSVWTYGVWSNSVSDVDWQNDTIDLSAFAGNIVILSWTGYTTWWQCDIALDEITIQEKTSAPVVINTYPYNQGFDTEPNADVACCSGVNLISAGWSNGSGDDCDWKPRDVNTPSIGTGPTLDESGTGSYLYMEASSCYSKTAFLESPRFDFSQETSPFIQFYYHMYGATVATMKLEWSLDRNLWFGAWSGIGDQGNSWKLAFADLGILAGMPEVYFRLTGTTGTTYESDMAFDGFQGFGSGAPLPVDLISFGGELSDDKSLVTLEWIVTSQVNNNYFEIQRSTNVEQWISIGEIPGAGNSNSQMHYTMHDENPLKGVSYYRLKQTDYDGNSETFYPISISNEIRPHVLEKVINYLGQEVDDTYEGFVIEIYQDGTTEKKYKLNKQ